MSAKASAQELTTEPQRKTNVELPAPKETGTITLEDLLELDLALAEITTVSRREEKVSVAPATVIVIGKNDIRLRGYATLNDIIRDLPGVEFNDYQWSELGTRVVVRGVVGNNKIVVMLNGMRLNAPGGEFMVFGNDLSVRAAEQIEVVYGPGSTLYGQDAMSMVINIRTLKPTEDSSAEFGGAGGFPARASFWGRVSTSLGDQGTELGKAKVLAYAQYINQTPTDLPKAFPNEWEAYAAKSEARGTGSGQTRFDESLNLVLRAEYGGFSLQALRRQSTRSSSEGFPSTFARIPEAVWADSSTVVEAKHHAALSDVVELESILTFNRYEIDPRTRYVFAGTDTTWFLNDFKYAVASSGTLEERVSWTPHTSLSIQAGLTGAYKDVVPKSTVPGGARPGTDLIAAAGTFDYYTDVNDESSLVQVPRLSNPRYGVFGAYLEGAWVPHERFRISAGARIDKDTRFSELPISPRIAAIGKITNELTGKAIFTGSYVSPAPYFSYSTYFDGASINTINTALKPERAWSTEVSLSFDRPNFSAGISGYLNFQNNLINPGDSKLPENIVLDTVYTRLGDPASGVLLTQSANAGTSRALGFDLYAKGKLGPVSPWARYSFVDFHRSVVGQNAEGQRTELVSGLQQVSAHNFRVGLTWAILSNLSITGSFWAKTRPENIPDPSALPEFFRGGEALHAANAAARQYEFSLHLLFSPSRNLDVFLDIKNVTDNKYAHVGLAGNLYPAEAFRGMLGARVSW